MPRRRASIRTLLIAANVYAILLRDDRCHGEHAARALRDVLAQLKLEARYDVIHAAPTTCKLSAKIERLAEEVDVALRARGTIFATLVALGPVVASVPAPSLSYVAARTRSVVLRRYAPQ